MRMLGGFALVGSAAAAVLIRSAFVSLAVFFLADTSPVAAADLPDFEPISYTYFNLEGGYVHLDGEEVQAFLLGPAFREADDERFIDISDGFYGRAELGHMWNTGILDGVGVYVQGWEGDDEDISETDFGAALAYKHKGNLRINEIGCNSGDQPCSTGRADLERSLIEVGLRFFHDYGDAINLDGLSLGIEPFVAFIDEDTSSTIGFTGGPFEPTSSRSSDLGATAYGALLALDARHHVLERTVLIGRVAAGAYYMDADVDTDHSFISDPIEPDAHDDLSSDFFGFRGQLALGIEQMLTEAFSVGVIGRLDYWSDFPSMEWTDATTFPDDDASNDSIASDDFLALSIGARISVNFR